MGFKWVEADGTGGGLCGSNGFYLIAARHKTDRLAFFVGVAFKAATDNSVWAKEIYNNRITVRATNPGGTVTFNYDDGTSGATTLGTDGVTGSWLLSGFNIMDNWPNP